MEEKRIDFIGEASFTHSDLERALSGAQGNS